MNSEKPRRRSRLRFETRITVLALLGGAPALAVAAVLMWRGDYSAKTVWTVGLVMVGLWVGCALALRERVVRPIQTLSNLLGALREEDYTLRAHSASPDDVLSLAFMEANALGDTLREQRLGALEAAALLRTVMAEINVAVFAFDNAERLRLVNRAGERLLARSAGRLLGSSAAELGLAGFLEGDSVRIVQMAFPGREGRWGIRTSTFREKGLPHRLLVVADLTRELREEELRAWKRLVRVMGHELNNSLAPIRSIAGSLKALIENEPQPPEWRDDMRRGLDVVSARAEALSRFMEAYARLAKLPPPRMEPVDVPAWIRRVAQLETRMTVAVVAGPDLAIRGDGDQLEQLLINLVRNAADAALPTGGEVAVGWRQANAGVEVWVQDDGPGVANMSNLFVPFFTTKPAGAGIGLILSRQIAEAHGGRLTLENRQPGPGCVARLSLPLTH